MPTFPQAMARTSSWTRILARRLGQTPENNARRGGVDVGHALQRRAFTVTSSSRGAHDHLAASMACRHLLQRRARVLERMDGVQHDLQALVLEPLQDLVQRGGIVLEEHERPPPTPAGLD